MIVRIAVSALIAGFGAGLVHALLQYVFIQPLLLHAELFELGPAPALDQVTVPRGPFDLMRELATEPEAPTSDELRRRSDSKRISEGSRS